MSILTAKAAPPASYAVDELFSLQVSHRMQSTLIIMKLFTPTVNTKDIPWTYSLLKQQLPSILSSKCFNEEQLPFAVEVRRTEIGHLFEHILLEYLCKEKLLKGYNRAMFSGNTKWNWERDPWGMFHIIINMHATDMDIFPPSLEKGVNLLRMIFRNDSTELYMPQVSYNAIPHTRSLSSPE
jgi:hypothetical protein